MLKVLLFSLSVLLLSGCVHDISIAPEPAKIVKTRPVIIQRTVAYYIPTELYEQRVETPGGNNDTLRYTPYKDTEESLKKALSNVFTKVYKIDTLDDPKITEKKIQFIFTPHIETMSYSNSNVDWQPTKFSIVLKVKVLRADGNVLFTTYAQGKGIANFGRYEEDPTYAVKVATRSAFLQFQDEIITKRKKFK